MYGAIFTTGHGSGEDETWMRRRYTRLLTARSNIPNGCFSVDGERLVPGAPLDAASFGLAPDEHFFVGLSERRSNRYGWVTVYSRAVWGGIPDGR